MRADLLIVVGMVALAVCQCDHPIFCEGEILRKVQLSGYFPDSKTFVDMPLKYDLATVLSNFNKTPLSQFLSTNFLPPQSILLPAQLPDWQPNPFPFDLISSPQLKQFANALHLKWKGLAKKFSLRQLSTLSTCKQNCTTILEVLDEKVFVAPGGRFRECYYWDSFWIVKGLLQSRMLETAEAVIRSFMLVVETYGYVPNGMRVYYLGRSQPPLFALMVSELANTYRMEFQSLKAIELERDALPVLLKEHQFWMATHSREVVVNGKNFTVNFYNANTSTPRPESYKEDYRLTENMTVQERSRLLKDIASAAESGWDFSTRWFADGKNLNTTRTTEIIPSDLNTFMALMQKSIAQIAQSQSKLDLYTQYTKLFNMRRAYFTQILSTDLYPDYKTQPFYSSSLFPFLLNLTSSTLNLSQNVVPVTSFSQSGQQWDYPNVWAPNVWVYHEISKPEEQIKIAQKWVNTVYCGWRKYNAMFEKYDTERVGERGQGGEYVVQEGFGWTNGLTLEMIVEHGQELTAPKSC